jgi:hypothetical protein
LEDLSDGVEKGMEDQIEPDQPEQMVGYRQLKKTDFPKMTERWTS